MAKITSLEDERKRKSSRKVIGGIGPNQLCVTRQIVDLLPESEISQNPPRLVKVGKPSAWLRKRK